MKFQILGIAALFAGTQATSVGTAALPVEDTLKEVENMARFSRDISTEFVHERSMLEGRQFTNICSCENNPAKCCCSLFTQAGQHSILHWLCVDSDGQDCTKKCR